MLSHIGSIASWGSSQIWNLVSPSAANRENKTEQKEEKLLSPEQNKKLASFNKIKEEKIAPLENNAYKATRIILAKARVSLEEFLESMIDEQIYESEFRTSKIDMLNRYAIEPNQQHNKNLLYYKNMVNGLVNLEKLLGEFEVWHDYAMNISLNVPYNIYQAPYCHFFPLIQGYREFYDSLLSLKLIDMLSSLSEIFSSEGMQTLFLNQLPMQLHFAKEKILENFFYNSFINHHEQWMNVINASKNWLESVKKILQEFSQNTHQTSVQETLGNISNVLHYIHRFNNSAQGSTDLFSLIFHTYSDGKNLMNNFTTTLVELQTDFYVHILQTAEQLNSVLKNFCLQLDILEMELSLKENALLNLSIGGTSIHSLAEKLKNWVKDFGYEFKEEECYPYHAAKLTQRVNLQTTSNTLVESKEGINLLARRVISGRADLQAAKRQRQFDEEKAQRDLHSKKTRKVLNLIEKRIHQLVREKRLYPQINSIKSTKLHALCNLRDKLLRNLSYPNAIDHIAVEHHHYLYALLQGRTGSILTEIENTLATQLDRIDHVDLTIQQLSKELSQNFYFRNHHRKNLLARRIHSLKLLKSLLVLRGVTIDDAKMLMNAKKTEDYEILMNYEAKLVNTLENIDHAQSEKTTELLLNDNEYIRENSYPALLKNVTKIREVEKVNGFSYREIYFDKQTPMLRQTNIRRKSLFAIQGLRVPGLIPQTTYNAQESLGTKVIDSEANKLMNQGDNAMSIEVINRRILAIQEEKRHSHHHLSDLEKEERLLSALRDKLNQYSFPEAMSAIFNEPTFKSHYYLLHQGRTGISIRYIEKQYYAAPSIEQMIRLSLMHLREKRKTISFFSASEPHLEERVKILTRLLQLQMENRPLHGICSEYELRILQTYDRAIANHDALKMPPNQADVMDIVRRTV